MRKTQRSLAFRVGIRPLLFLFAIIVPSFALNLDTLTDNRWTEVISKDQSFNLGNWTYENDANADPVNGVLWVGPGHRGSPQDNIMYVYDPLTGTFSTPHTALPPAKSCLRHFVFSTQDTAILLMGGVAGHQNSMGVFDTNYKHIEDKLWVGYGIYYYRQQKNEWVHMRTPGLNGGFAAYKPRLRYDPVHDIVIYHQTKTMIYSLHHNSWRNVTVTAGPGVRENYASGLDEKRGLYYLLGGTNKSYCTDPVNDMWSFNPETETWSQVTGFTVAPWESTATCTDYNTSMAYSARSDAILFPSRTGAVFAFDCETRDWSRFTTAGSPLTCAGHMAYDVRNNLFYLLGGSFAPQGITDQRTTQGLWVCKYRNSKNLAWEAKLAAPDARVELTATTVTVHWQPGTGYRFNLYRAPALPYPKGFVKLNAVPLTGTQYVDNSAMAGTAYSYRVAAVDADGKEGHLSRHLYTIPARPLGVAASVEAVNLVHVSWEPNSDPGIAGYHVYRARKTEIYASTFQYVKLTAQPVAGTFFADNTVDLSDTVARGYVVTAINVQGIESGLSPTVTTFPTAPLHFRAFKKQGATVYSKWVGQSLEGPNIVDSTILLWQPPARTRIAGVNFYRGATHSVADSPTFNTALITDSLTTWYTRGQYGAGTFNVRAVNILGQEGFLSDQICPDNGQYTNGTHPFDAFSPRTLPPIGQSLAPEAGNLSGITATLTAYPNPVRSTVVIKTRQASPVQIFDPCGRLVARLNPEGRGGQCVWKAADMPAGVYTIRAMMDGKMKTRKIALLH